MLGQGEHRRGPAVVMRQELQKRGWAETGSVRGDNRRRGSSAGPKNRLISPGQTAQEGLSGGGNIFTRF